MYLSLDLVRELEMLLGFLRGRSCGDASVPRAFDFHCSGDACRLVDLGLVAPDIVCLSFDLISELEVILLGDGALRRLMLLPHGRA